MLSKDALDLYNSVFRSMGMTFTDLWHLMRRAEKIEFKRGEKLITQGQAHNFLFMVTTGQVTEYRDNKYDFSAKKYEFVGTFSYTAWRQRHVYDRESWEGHALLKQVQKVESERQVVGRADDICETETCVAYRWSYQALQEIYNNDKRLDAIFEKYLSADLYKKLQQKMEQGPSSLYKLLLSAFLLEGYVSGRDKDVLTSYRTEYDISNDTHQSILNELGWTDSEYEMGSKRIPVRSELQKYQDMLNKELESGSVSVGSRERLRLYRLEHRITDLMHIDALSRVPSPFGGKGWTLNDYEAGELAVKEKKSYTEIISW